MNHTTDHFTDQEVEFEYDGYEYIWAGDYTIEESIEEETYDYPAFGEIEITIDHTSSLAYYDHENDIVVQVKPTPSLLLHVELIIEHNL